MKFAAAVLGLCFASVAPALAASPPQALAIVIAGDGARATELPVYDPGKAIAVTVTQSDTAGAVSAVTIEAMGPDGVSQHAVLAHTAKTAFSGSITLPDGGTWQLRVTSRIANLDSVTAPVTLSLQAPPPSNADAIGIAVGTAIFIVFGGGGFLLLRRRLAGRPSNDLQQAA